MALVAGLAPLQISLAHYAGLGDVRPDLCLVAAVLIGFVAGPIEGLLMGAALGFTQDLFSAGVLWPTIATRGAAGLLAGLAGRQVTNATLATLVTTLAGVTVGMGLAWLFAARGGADLGERLAAMPSILLPEVLLNVLFGVLAYWLLPLRPSTDRELGRRPIGLVG
jgi:uncharacterized membrane protein